MQGELAVCAFLPSMAGPLLSPANVLSPTCCLTTSSTQTDPEYKPVTAPNLLSGNKKKKVEVLP